MEYKIEQKEGFSFYGYKKKVTTVNGQNFEIIPKFWQASMADGSFGQMMAKGKANSCLGVCMPMDPEKDTDFDYIIGAFADTTIEGYENHTVAAGDWAVFTVIGLANLQDTWKKIYSEWLPSTNYINASLPELEVYLEGDVDREDYKMEVWIPVVKGHQVKVPRILSVFKLKSQSLVHQNIVNRLVEHCAQWLKLNNKAGLGYVRI